MPPFPYLYLFVFSDCNQDNTKKTDLTMEVVCGSIVSANRASPTSEMRDHRTHWRAIMTPVFPTLSMLTVLMCCVRKD